MRRKLVLGLGLAGVLSGSAAAQFAVDRVPPAAQPQAPAAAPPVLPATSPVRPAGGYVPPVGGFQPAGAAVPATTGFRPATNVAPTMPAAPAAEPAAPLDIPLALGPNHPLALRAEHGAYFLCVKSYSRPSRPDPNDPGLTARELAEGLAAEIRQMPQARRLNVYLYEYVSEEKRAEAAARAAALQRAAAFRASLETYRQQSQLLGRPFEEPDNRVRYKTFNYRDQIAVLLGGFATEDDAVKALAKVKAWPAPKNARLMDAAARAQPGPDDKQRDKIVEKVVEGVYLNPFQQAMVVPNPAAPKAAGGPAAGLDPFLVKLNEGRPYSLLGATKGWTLAVKSFMAPVQIQSKDEQPSVMQRIGFSSKGADALKAGAEQAETLAKTLRHPSMRPHPFEAFVMHTRTGSFVTVGQFDGPDDPTLVDARRVLMGITFNTSKDEQGREMTGTGQRLFGDTILAIPVPKP